VESFKGGTFFSSPSSDSSNDFWFFFDTLEGGSAFFFSLSLAFGVALALETLGVAVDGVSLEAGVVAFVLELLADLGVGTTALDFGVEATFVLESSAVCLED